MKPMDFEKLLAKAPTTGAGAWAARYVGHTSAVMDAAKALIIDDPTKDFPTSWLTSIFESLKLSVDQEYFQRTVLLGAYLHDWGKASEPFQVMVHLKGTNQCLTEECHQRWNELGKKQLLRHEIISGILALGTPCYRRWLENYANADLMAAVWAGMGHHLKVGGARGKKIDEIVDTHESVFKLAKPALTVYTQHSDFQGMLRMGHRRLDLPSNYPDLLQDQKETWTGTELKSILDNLCDEFYDFSEEIERDRDYQRFVAAVKATVVAADIAGSALPKNKHSIKEWIPACFKNTLTKEDIQSLVENRLEGQELRDFQAAIAASESRVTLVRAGCGTGKTIGAYKWAEKYAIGKKLYFSYPTTGTASEGFKDYAAKSDFETHLMHSRAEIDQQPIELETILVSNEGDYENEGDAQSTNSQKMSEQLASDPERIDLRLRSFEAWQAKLIVSTVDSVLGLMQNYKKPLFSWPAIVQSAFVFDEVHSYDEKLFGAFLRFLETFQDVPILIMSASFTDGQIEAIQKTLAKLGDSLNEVPGPEDLESLERYVIQQANSKESVWEQVRIALQNSTEAGPAKILWVTNTVDSCIEIYKEFYQEVKKLKEPPKNLKPRIYHSRYRYQDRRKRHREVIDDFQGDGPAFAITTQVCEMSLDLSATLLISAMAPASALIQRLGRLNRKVEQDKGQPPKLVSGTVAPAWVYPWQEKFPYDSVELQTGIDFLKLLPAKAISQKDLAEAATQLTSYIPKSMPVTWLDGLWRSHPGALRDSEHSITVVLEKDLAKIRQIPSFRQAAEIQAWTVPIPLNSKIRKIFASWPREGCYPIAPSEEVSYCEQLGAQVQK
jgi:CRISPR-associated endonuclease/helicase Cas3